MKSVISTALLVDTCADIVLNSNLIVQVPHDVTALLNCQLTRLVINAGLTERELFYLMAPNIKLVRCNELHLTTLLPDLKLCEFQREGKVYLDTQDNDVTSDEEDTRQNVRRSAHEPHNCVLYMQQTTV